MLSDDDPVPFFASLPALGLTLLVVAKPAFRLQRCVCQTEQVPRAKHIRFSAFNPPPRTTDSWLVLHRKGENKGLESTMKLDLHNLHLPSESPRQQHVILFSAWLFRAPSFAIPGCGYRRGGSGSRIVEWLVVSTQKVVSIPIINIGIYIYIYIHIVSASVYIGDYINLEKSSKFICSKWTHPWSY